MSKTVKRSLVDIMSEIFELTREMREKKDNSDHINAMLDKRAALIEEFDKLREAVSDDEYEQLKPELRGMADEMLKLDAEVLSSLKLMRESAKQELKDSTQQNKILNYANKAISSSGSYMDFKE